MENTEEESVVGLLVDLTENEKVETIATFLNERTPPDIPSFADEIPIVSVESDDSVVFISENLELNNSEDNNTVTLDVEESPLLAITLNKVEKRAADCGAGQLSKTIQSKSIQEDEKSKCETVETIQSCDGDTSMKQISSLEDRETSNSEEDFELKRRINFLNTIVDKSFNHAKNGLDRNYDCLQKVFTELLQGRQKFLEEMSNNSKNLKCLLHTASMVKDKKKRSGLLDCLEACFSVGHWMDLSFKPKRLDDCKASMKDFVSSNYGGVKKVKKIFEEYLGSKSTPEENLLLPKSSSNIDPYLVTVTAVEHPGSFYIVRYSDMDTWRSLFNLLKENAPSFPVPEEIVTGKQYAVCNSSGNWYRGVCGKICGDYACGGLNGKLYRFFLPDQGGTELFNSFSIRILSQDLMDYPQMAIECSLHQNFNVSNIWSASATSAFKQMVRRSPMNMKVFGCESGVLNVDLAQLACFGEDSNIVSVRDALVLMGGGRPMTSTPLFVDQAPAKRVKPRFSETTQPTHFIGIVTSPFMPNNIYVQVVDEQPDQFHEMHQQLQFEFRDATNTSPSFIQHPRKGHTYAVKYTDNLWYRILLEDISNDYCIFYIDTGHRNFVAHPECHQLPDKFFHYPAQAVRCILAGIAQPGVQRNAGRVGASRLPMKYPREIRNYLEPLKGKEVMVFSVDWLVGGTGFVKHNNDKEMATVCVLYENEKRCLNYVLAQTKLVKSERNHVYSVHSEKLLKWSKTRMALEANSSANVSTDSGDTLTLHGSESTNGACSLLSSIPVEKITPASNFCQLPEIIEPFETQADLEGHKASKMNLSSSDRTVSFDAPSWIDLKNEEFVQLSMANDQQMNDDLRSSAQSTGKLETCYLTSPEEFKSQSNNGTKPKKPVVSPYSDNEVVAYRGTQPVEHEVGIVATFIWCDSPASIFFRTSELQKKYEKMKKLIKRQYSNMEPQTSPLKFEVGFPCVVYCDADWCRAEVVDTDAYPECTVSLIDKGYQRKVQAIDIYPMTPELEVFPRTVLQVSLCGVYPPQGSVWNDAVAKYIGERLLGAIGPEPIKIFSRGRATSNKSTNLLTAMVCYDYMVKETAMEIGGKTRFNLNEELIDLGYCSNRPSERVPLAPVRTVSTAWKPFELPQKKEFWGKVTWVNIEGEIFLHDVRLAPKLQELEKWLSAAYHNTKPSDADLTCKPGDLCIAKYEQDGEWYRAVVQEVGSEPGRATVIFVDYGTRDSVQLKNIRLDIKFEAIPILALRCTLHNIRVPDSGNQLGGAKAPWPLETLNILHSMIVEEEFRVTIKNNGIPLQVHLLSRNKGVISKKLVEQGLAEFVETKQKKSQRKNKNKNRK